MTKRSLCSALHVAAIAFAISATPSPASRRHRLDAIDAHGMEDVGLREGMDGCLHGDARLMQERHILARQNAGSR